MTRADPKSAARVALLAASASLCACISSADDLQLLVGRDWNAIRPSPCEGETALHDREPPQSYALVSRRGRILFVYRAGEPIFEEPLSEHERAEQEERRADVLPVLGVVDLGALDWDETVFSAGIFDAVVCRAGPATGGSRADRAAAPELASGALPPGQAGETVLATVVLEEVASAPFPADRAWRWNPRTERFEPLAGEPPAVCEFDPLNGETPERFRATWPELARATYRCEM